LPLEVGTVSYNNVLYKRISSNNMNSIKKQKYGTAHAMGGNPPFMEIFITFGRVKNSLLKCLNFFRKAKEKTYSLLQNFS
jgi:hypothetical protein